jgi:hypothetical protein
MRSMKGGTAIEAVKGVRVGECDTKCCLEEQRKI